MSQFNKSRININAHHGLFYLIQGFYWLARPELRHYVWLPLLFNLCLFGSVFFYSIHEFSHLVGWLDASVPSALHFLIWLLWPIFLIAIGLLFTYTFTLVGSIIMAPFCGTLSEKVMALQGWHPKNSPQSPLKKQLNNLRSIPRAFYREGQKAKYYLPYAAIFLILWLIPGVNLFSGIIWFFYVSWVMSLQFLDYPMDVEQISVRDMLQHMRRQRWKYLTFGMSVSMCTLIPILNFCVIPAATIGATLMRLDEII